MMLPAISEGMRLWFRPAVNEAARARLERQLPTLLSVIAGMVDLIGFLTLGNIFTAHITGNLVVIAAVLVRGGPVNPAQALAIPIFMLAAAAIWLVARASRQQGPALARLLLAIQFLLLLGVLIFSVVAEPSADPRGLAAGVAAMIAVAAMACQFALLRLAIPGVPSTAVMTGNLTNVVLSSMDVLVAGRPLPQETVERLRASLHLLVGFFFGCVVAALVVSLTGDWAWLLPVLLAGVAVALG